MARVVKEKPKRNRNSYLREDRQTRREQAKTRQATYDLLTPEQKLARLDGFQFAAKKQRAKLDALIAARREAAATPKKEKKS